MPGFQDRQQVRSEELYEAALTGPFGGIQSELPLTGIEAFGFADQIGQILIPTEEVIERGTDISDTVIRYLVAITHY